MLGRIDIASLGVNGPSSYATQHIDVWWEQWGEVVTNYVNWLPAPGHGKAFPDVPSHIARAAGEAHICVSVGATMSGVLMARTVTEATAKEKGVTSGRLVAKIDSLYEKGVITELLKDTAHTIRQFGNDMAHGDIAIPVDAVDAKVVLSFMDMLLEHVFQVPAKLAALQETVEKRKEAPSSDVATESGVSSTGGFDFQAHAGDD